MRLVFKNQRDTGPETFLAQLLADQLVLTMPRPEVAHGTIDLDQNFKPLKAELPWRGNWQTCREVEVVLFEYISGICNPRRRRSTPGWKSLVAFERKAA